MIALPASPPTDQLSIVRDHQVRIWRYLRCLGCGPTDAEDLTQETFLAVLRQPFEDRGPARTAAYLQTVARNLFLKSRRPRALREAQVDLDQAEAAWQHWCERDRGDGYAAALRHCLDELDGRGRDAVRLRYEHGLSRGAMAKQLRLSEDGIKSLLRRVRQILRTCVERRIR